MTQQCLFCNAPSSKSVLEHIIPQSLGGCDEEAAVRGLVCAKCNNYFGSHIERAALSSFPFNVYRVMNAVVTKKGRPASLPIMQGRMLSTPTPNIVELVPGDEAIHQGVMNGNITQCRVLAEVAEELAVCRLLLKMGCEHLATIDTPTAHGERLASARTFVRAPKKGSSWWFLLLSDPSRFQQEGQAFLDVVEMQGALMVHFHGICFDLLSPLVEGVAPSPDLDAPPHSRLYRPRN